MAVCTLGKLESPTRSQGKQTHIAFFLSDLHIQPPSYTVLPTLREQKFTLSANHFWKILTDMHRCLLADPTLHQVVNQY